MPTLRARHMITETDEIRAAIDEAAAFWPDAAGNRAELVRRLLLQGAPSALETETRRRIAFLASVDDAAGSMRGVYPNDAARSLTEEWPD
ncbi:hypothetical protein [Microbacterium mangrovi]|uniref:hypothetical protein n=1 Tax=Microbacterium mangrovi TaxID=1348253 RepID=UPI000690DFBF|nr:hypothetical protein [Microbacterium mangrovi]